MNGIKTTISTFNQANLSSTPVEITSSFLDPQHQVVLLSFFESKAKAMEYYAMFTRGSEQLVGVNDQGYPAFAISQDNYSQLYKSKDVGGYTTFFTENYLDRQ
jgi:hypothetical protein